MEVFPLVLLDVELVPTFVEVCSQPRKFGVFFRCKSQIKRRMLVHISVR